MPPVALTQNPFVENPRPELGLVTDWYVNGATGNDNNDGQSPSTAFATMEKLNSTLWPGGAYLTIFQDVNVHLAAGAGSTPASYTRPRPRCRAGAGLAVFLSLLGETTQTADFTGTTFVNSNPATPTRGEVTAAGATFTAQGFNVATTGANAGATTYSSGLNGGATDSFLFVWTDLGGNEVNLTNGDHVARLTNLVTIQSLDAVFESYGDGGGLFMQNLHCGDAAGAVFTATSGSLRDGVTWFQCEFFADTSSWSTGNSLFVSCAWHGSYHFGAGFWRFGGSCVFQQTNGATDTILFDHAANVQFEGGNGSDGMKVQFTRGTFCEFIRSASTLEGLEFENGAGVSSGLEFDQATWWYASNYPFWGVTGNYTVGLTMLGPSFGSFAQAAPVLSIPSATNVKLNGQSYTWADVKQGLRVGSCVIDNTASEALDSPIVHLTAQAAAKALTNLYAFTPPPGTYLVGVETEVTTVGTAGTISGNAAAKGDGAAARTQTGTASGAITALGANSYVFVVRSDGTGNVQYGTTFNGVTVGTLQYAITAWAKRIGN